jgi:hypothetical protein
MTADELKDIAQRVYGPQWKLNLAIDVGCHTNSIDRWMRDDRIPKYVESLVLAKDKNLAQHLRGT